MSRVVLFDEFGGPDRLLIRHVPKPRPRAGEVRVRVTSIGLNPMDWKVLADADLARTLGVTLPSGFAHDFAGVVDEVANDVSTYAIGDRVFGSVSSRAAADHILVGHEDLVYRTPDALADTTAATLTVSALTASAALSAVRASAADTVLIGGAAGGVGVFATQLAHLAGARVLGTAGPETLPFVRELSVEPIPYGADLAERLARSPGLRVTAAVDLHGTDTAYAALALGVHPRRIVTIAAGPSRPAGVQATGAHDAPPGSLHIVTDAILGGHLHVPIEATFGLEEVRAAVSLQAEGHTHGKIVLSTA